MEKNASNSLEDWHYMIYMLARLSEPEFPFIKLLIKIMIASVIDTVNAIVNSRFHLECRMFSYSVNTLIVALSEDLIYYHEYEVHFKDVFTVSCNSDWRIDTAKPFINLVEDEQAYEINIRHGVEIGNTIFKLGSEDALPLYIVAGDIEFRENMVKYYK